jgi:hypothetical protein
MKPRRRELRTSRLTLAASFGVAAVLFLSAGAAVAASGTLGLLYPDAKTASVPDNSVPPEIQPLGPSNSCPKKFLAVGGGAHVTGTDPDFDLEIQTTEPDHSNPRTWVNAIDNSTGSTAQATSFVICERASSHTIKYRVGRKIVAAGGQGVMSVSCPAGTKVTGGGADITGDHRAEISSSEPADGQDANRINDDAWFAVVNNGTSIRQHMTVNAVCSTVGRYKIVSSRHVRLPDNTQVAATAHCPAGSRVTGGGLGIRGFDNGYEVAGSFPIDGKDPDKLPDDGWTGIANNDGQRNMPDPHRNTAMNTFAVCRVA